MKHQFSPLGNIIKKDKVAFSLAVALAANCSIAVVAALFLILSGHSVKHSFYSTALGFGDRILNVGKGTDSWKPMLKAYDAYRADSERSLYTIFWEEGIKFQYPPASLLVFEVLPDSLLELRNGSPTSNFRQITGRVSQLAIIVVTLLTVLILEVRLRDGSNQIDPPRKFPVIRILLGALLCLTFDPLVQSHRLGQIQVYLTILVSCSVLFYLLKRPGLAGLCMGCCALVKPQWALLLLWALIRRNRAFALWMTVMLVIGITTSIVYYRWQNHRDYIAVLSAIARQGETFWPNQSVNGLVNRFLLNGDPVHWTPRSYAPFNGSVYFATLFSSLAFIVVGLWPLRNVKSNDDIEFIEFLILLLVATMASPIAWAHHYSILLPVGAASLPLLLDGKYRRGSLLAFGIGFVLAANAIPHPELIFANRWTGLAGSHLFLGSLIILGVLLAVKFQYGNSLAMRLPTESVSSTLPRGHENQEAAPS